MKRPVRTLLRILFWTVAASILAVTILKWVPVRYTPLMLKRMLQGKGRPHQEWVRLEEVSPALIQACIAAEDNRFMDHHGFDRVELEMMWTAHRNDGKEIRGCSTISQQVAKNVFTLGTSTWARKAVEAYWTVLIEKIWGKRRIMEVYLNVAETGPGLYGVQAAARHYYGLDAKDIDRKQACAIAARLPTPLEQTNDDTASHRRIRQRQIHALIPTLVYPEWALANPSAPASVLSLKFSSQPFD